MKNKFIYLAVLAAGFISCEPEFENEVSNASYSSGDADFSSYVAVGNSLTAGYMDGTVSRVGQSYSYPNTLAGQFAVVGGGIFTQPSFEDDINNLGGLTLGGFPIGGTRIIINASAGGPQPISGSSTIEVSNLQAQAYHNMGVPGAKSFHLLSNTYGDVAGVVPQTANPYFVRHATSASATVLGDAMSMNPTFFTNWIGNNDILSYATSGGIGVDRLGNLNPATYGPNDITDPQVFASVYSTIINTLTSGPVPAKGVVATIPEVTSIPYFTTVPFNAVPLDAATAAQLNSGYATYNAGLVFAYNNSFISEAELSKRTISFRAGKNAVVMVDEYLTNLSGFGIPSYRHATSSDLIVLPAMSFIGTLVGGDPLRVNGVSEPLADKWVLSKDEKMLVANATAAFNNAIVSIAASKNIAVADMNAIMTKLKGGLTIEDGTIYTANYFSSATAGTVLFSLDGVHPNARGYAVISNEIIKVINSFYNANIPLVSAAGFPGATILTSN